MSDHLVLYVDNLFAATTLESNPVNEVVVNAPGRGPDVREVPSSSDVSSTTTNDPDLKKNMVSKDEEEPLIQMVECRICQEEDHTTNLEIPCACSGSLKYAHRKCVQRWCNEKGDITCEICHQPYKPGYIAPPRTDPDDTTIDIGAGWTISGTPFDLHDSRILAMATAERRLLEAEYDEYTATNASGAAFCRSAALILMALLLLRHALTVTNPDGDDDDASAYFSLFLLRAAGFLIPCYIMAWVITVLQRRRQRQEAAAALAATDIVSLLQAEQQPGVHFAIAPQSSSFHDEPLQ